MTSTITPHLNFHGNAREALAFYGSVLGAEPVLRTYGDVGMPAGLPDTDKVVWGQVESADGVRVMAYDVPGSDGPARQPGATRRADHATLTDQPYFLSLRCGSLDEATGLWKALGGGAEVLEPLAASAWSAGFGMLTDRFGVTWVVDVA